MIRRYPQLKAEHDDLHTSSLTADYSGDVHGSGVFRTTENLAIKELPTTRQREYEAVSKAIATTERCCDGRDRLEIINLVFWKQTHTLEGASLQIPCSYRTACRWHEQFIKLVAKNFGLMDE